MFHLAQVNIARARFPLEDPRMLGFTARLAEINAIAESSPGFIWRSLDDESPFDSRTVINISVWQSVEALKEFSYTSIHKELFRNRHQWFERLDRPSLAMWWIPAGTVPAMADAVARLNHIRDRGETAQAFTFRSIFPPPETGARRAQQA
jgi:hypothetical protein